jgi:hypothetical protein
MTTQARTERGSTMKVQHLPEMARVLQAGIEEYYGLHATIAPPLDSHDPEIKLMERELKMNLFWLILNIHSPTGKQISSEEFQWHFILANGNHVHMQHGGGSRQFGHCPELTPETEIQSVEVVCRKADDDFLCFLRPYVKKKMPKVNVLLGRR